MKINGQTGDAPRVARMNAGHGGRQRKGHSCIGIFSCRSTAVYSGCDLIVMVRHGRGALGELLFGSPTQNVLARSQVPMFMLHCRFAWRRPAASSVSCRRFMMGALVAFGNSCKRLQRHPENKHMKIT